MICQTCGAAIPEHVSVCAACGMRVEASMSETRLWAPPAALGLTRVHPGDNVSSEERPMERIIIRHLTGSKANHVDEFPLSDFTELTFGRDPDSGVQFDPQQDDLVSRNHAKVVRDATDTGSFTVIDMGSRNGTYVNKQLINGPTRLVKSVP
jgi:hypothetical protein